MTYLNGLIMLLVFFRSFCPLAKVEQETNKKKNNKVTEEVYLIISYKRQRNFVIFKHSLFIFQNYHLVKIY
jgi:hypothetical protein